MEKPTTTKATKKNITVYSDTESDKSSTSGASEPSPKRVNQKKTSRLWQSRLWQKSWGTLSQSTQSKNHEKPNTKSQYNLTSTHCQSNKQTNSTKPKGANLGNGLHRYNTRLSGLYEVPRGD